MFDTVFVRTARNRPSASSASSASVAWSRPWPSLRKLSERSAIHFTGRANPPGRPRREHVLGVWRNLDAERSAHVAGDHSNPRFRDAERPGERREQVAHALRRRPDGVAAVSRVVLGDDAAGLHRGDDEPVAGDLEPGHVRGAPERRIRFTRIAPFPVERDVARGGRPQQRCAGFHRGAAVDHHVELLVVDDDPLGRILRNAARACDNHRHGVADVHGPVASEQRVIDVDGGLAVAAPHRVRLAQRRDAVRLQVAMREDRDDTGYRLRVRRVDRDDPRVRVGRAHDPRVRLAGAFDVVDEPAAAGEQGGVLPSRDTRADGGDERVGHLVVLPGFVAERRVASCVMPRRGCVRAR